MAIVNDSAFHEWLARQGLDVSTIRRATLIVEAGCAPVLLVEKFLTREEAETLPDLPPYAIIQTKPYRADPTPY